MTPIIIPMNTTTQVDCIIQEGTKYCEETDVTSSELGVVILIVGVIVLWFIFCGWLSIKLEDDYYIDGFTTFIIGGIVLPLLAIGLILIF